MTKSIANVIGLAVRSRFLHDQRASSAVEFAIVSTPFIFTLLFILQMGIYYMAQSSLDAGVIKTADSLINSYNSGTAVTLSETALKNQIYTNSGSLFKNDNNFLVDVNELSALGAAPIAISGSIPATTAPGDVLALRAQATVVTFMPGFSSLATIRSSVLVRRQGT